MADREQDGHKREAFASRRALLVGAGGGAFAAALGAPIPFLDQLPAGLVPVALAQE